MTKVVIVDTGPLVAVLKRREQDHKWAKDILDSIEPPLLTCEAVLSEACFLMGDTQGGSDAILGMAASGILDVGFSVAEELERVRRLMKKYAKIPMSLADACLVRMTELHKDSIVLTLDSDFRIYRRNRRQLVPVIMPS